MLPQGVLPIVPVATSRRLKQQIAIDMRVRFLCCLVSLSCLARHIAMTNVTGTIHGKNSLWQHGQGWDLGIPPLRAIDFGWYQDLPGAPMTALMGFREGRIITGEARG